MLSTGIVWLQRAVAHLCHTGGRWAKCSPSILFILCGPRSL